MDPTREVGGKTVTRVIPPGAVEQTRRQLAEHKRFRGLTRELVETSEQLCDALQVAARAVERRLNADTCDHGGPTSSCP